jgi:NADPH2:quinone reductase
MARAVRIHKTGGPERLTVEEVQVDSPGEGEVRLRQTAIGLNFIDTYLRSGLYPLPSMPAILGMEAAGVVVELGPGVTSLAVGDRVGYCTLGGAYVDERLAPADKLIPLPDTVDDESAAAVLLKGMTAEYLLRRTYAVAAGETILIHAAAGGVGLIACQWAKALGATVIGTVGTDEKAELARQHGCHHPIVYTREDFVARVKELTDGRGVPVVYDSVGQVTFQRSLQCLRTRGLMVTFGQSSGKLPPFVVGELNWRGSLYLTRPSLGHYTASREDLLSSAAALFERMESGDIKVEIRQRYPLAEVVRAHQDLEARKTVGSSVVIP